MDTDLPPILRMLMALYPIYLDKLLPHRLLLNKAPLVLAKPP